MDSNIETKSNLTFSLVSIMPDMFDAIRNYGVVGRAVRSGLINILCWNPRNYTTDKHSMVDDRPYGGGPGMVMKAEPIKKAIAAAKSASATKAKVVMLTPHGIPLKQNLVEQLTGENHLILVSGRYEGIDQRIETEIDLNISIGDYILSGGELASMILIDSISRLVAGTLGHEKSTECESFSMGLLDYPQYTRPVDLSGDVVPKVLLSGNHEKIAEWRMQQSLGLTWLLRPDLLENIELSEQNQFLLDDFIDKYRKK